MTEVLDRYDRRVARTATGELAELNAAGVIEAADVHVASRLATLVGEEDPLARVTLALVVRAAREGSTSLDPAHARELLAEAFEVTTTDYPVGDTSTQRPGAVEDTSTQQSGAVEPPPTPAWLEQVRGSALAEAGVLLVEHDLVYLDRYHREEVQVAQDLQRRAETPAPEVDEQMLEAGLERVFPSTGWGEQSDAVRAAAGRLTTVLAGGPGTGKTSTVAGLLTLLLEQAEATGHRPRIALAAPTGKAAARLRESVLGSLGHMPEQDRQRLGTDIEAVTVHRLLGWRPDSGNRFRRDRGNPLPHDIVVVDEASMLSLTLTARLLEALRPSARLLLVGDPDQLASVEAGAVLADLVAGYGGDGPVARLQTSHRFGHEIGALAEAVRVGDADRVLELLAQAGLPTGSSFKVFALVARSSTCRSTTSSRPTRPCAPGCSPTQSGCATSPSRAATPTFSASSASTGCCAPTATDRGASGRGTIGSSAGSPSRATTSVARSSAGRCS